MLLLAIWFVFVVCSFAYLTVGGVHRLDSAPDWLLNAISVRYIIILVSYSSTILL